MSLEILDSHLHDKNSQIKKPRELLTASLAASDRLQVEGSLNEFAYIIARCFAYEVFIGILGDR